MMPPTEVAVRVLVLLVYTITAALVAWHFRESGWFVLHATGAGAGACAAGLAISYAGAIGEATPDDGPDQARDYMEGWDD